MSSQERSSHNRTPFEAKSIEMCHRLLKVRAFKGARLIIHMNQSISSQLHPELEKALVICDILTASETRLPHGLLDCYGMIRMTQPGPVIWENIEKIMNLLEWGDYNPFPWRQQATERAYLAWSWLNNPTFKGVYDYAISNKDNLETQGNVLECSGVGGSQNGDRSECDITDGGRCEEGSKAPEPLPLAEQREAPDNQVRLEDTSFVHGKRKAPDNVGPGIDDEVIDISDDEDEDGEETISMARTSRLCIVNGKRVKLIPILKKKRK